MQLRIILGTVLTVLVAKANMNQLSVSLLMAILCCLMVLCKPDDYGDCRCIKPDVSDEYDADCNNTRNCEEADCIDKYDKDILKHQDLQDNLKETFFETGEGPAKFVTITYVCESTNCSSRKEMFIWSILPVYFLGPKPLLWRSLFAIRVVESSVTIKLPCLCANVTDKLLSQLTSWVRQYCKQFMHYDLMKNNLMVHLNTVIS